MLQTIFLLHLGMRYVILKQSVRLTLLCGKLGLLVDKNSGHGLKGIQEFCSWNGTEHPLQEVLGVPEGFDIGLLRFQVIRSVSKTITCNLEDAKTQGGVTSGNDGSGNIH